tara:strand:+ start:220 stop:414 length:195 start_codon:yes stop_codon:yes gene_type:complete
MLIIKIGENEKIDKALKRFKRRFRDTQMIKILRDKKHYTKKSTKKREQKQKSIYNRIKKESYDE